MKYTDIRQFIQQHEKSQETGIFADKLTRLMRLQAAQTPVYKGEKEFQFLG